jgi:GT2 family glycosyltransferase
MNSISVDIIIINYNSTDYTIRCIDSIKQNLNSCRIKIIVIDNNSNDMPNRIIDHCPGIQLIENEKNIGFGNAINYGLKLSVSKYLVLINPDALLPDRSFYYIIQYIDENPEIAIAGPKILDWDGSIQGSARRHPTIWTAFFGRKSPLTKFFPNNPITKKEFICFNGVKDNPQSVDWVSGACMIIRSEAVRQVGGFDNRFFMYWEDADLCKRLKEQGWEISYFPKAQVYHYIGKSSNTCQLLSIYHFHKSCYYYFTKHTRWPIKLITPMAFLGLGYRCLFVMGLNRIQPILDRLKSDRLKMRQRENGDKKKSKKIKILRIISRLNIGGPSIHCTILTKELCKTRFRSKLLIGKTSPHEGDMSYMINDDNGFLFIVPELQREINIIKDTIAFFKILKILFSYRPDIIHSHTSKAGTLARCAACLFNIFSKKKALIVHTFHGHVLEGYFSALKSKLFVMIERILARITHAIIAISQTQKWELTEKYQLAPAGKVHVINLGFDLSRFFNVRNKGTLRSTFELEDRTSIIGIVGRLTPIKNHRLFLDSAKLIIERYPDKAVRFAIIGDGELKSSLKAHARAIGIEKDVIFYGWEKNIERIYADLDILVLTSNNEGTPVSIIESMAASVPVVTTGVGGIKDLLGRIEIRAQTKDDFSICERGILCFKGNANAIANGIQHLIEGNNQDLINKAREFVFKNYTEKRLIERIENLYRNLM